MWNETKNKLLKSLWGGGKSEAEIAKQLRCSPRTVCTKVQRLGLQRQGQIAPNIVAKRSKDRSKVRVSRHQDQHEREYTKDELRAMLTQAVVNTADSAMTGGSSRRDHWMAAVP